MIFGGEAFHDWIGELSLMKDLTKTMDITMREEEEAAAAAEEGHVDPAATTAATAATASASSAPPPSSSKEFEAMQESTQNLNIHDEQLPAYSASPAHSGTSTPRPGGLPTRLAIEHSPSPSTEHLTPSEAAAMTEEEKRLREKQKKKGGLTKEQREELAAYEQERKRQRDERVTALSNKLINRLSVWTETDRSRPYTEAFKEQISFEIENLRMESFGLEILHAIGATYLMKATSFLKSQKLFGISGFWSRLKEKGTLAKETWTTISTAIDAQVTMEEMARLEEKGGEDWTDERKAEYEKRVTGKILAAAWRGSKFEIQSVLREVCEKVLNDKNVRLEKRVQRAEGLVIIGDMFSKVSPSSLRAVYDC
jgi:X-domain of DnaJ-containing